MGKFWEIISKEWEVLIDAPFSFVLTLVSAIATAYYAAKYRYGKVIDEKNAQLDSLKERIARRDDKIEDLEARIEKIQQYEFTDMLNSLHRKILELREAKDSKELEKIAGDLSRIPVREVTDVLLYRLGDWRVNDDRDTEDAFCSILTKLGLMRKLGNQRFVFREENTQPDYVKELLTTHRRFIPRKYFQRF